MKLPFRQGAKPLIDTRLILFATLFLISGCAGLVYEIVWERLLELYFGVTMYAITLIVAAYMCGLGLGSLLGGRISRRVKSVLLTYGLVELGTGLFGLFSPALINWIGKATAGSSYGVVFILSFGILLIPTFLMGMTLPLLSQAFIDRVNRAGHIVGIFYGINTLGAAIGALVSGYILIGWLGYGGTITVAFAMNLGVGLCAIILNRWKVSPKEESPQIGRSKSRAGWGYRTILLASFLVGFIGLGYEMLWVRVLNIINKNTAYGFPSILFIFLTGLAIGGYYWGSKADETSDPEGLFWKVELGVGIIVSLCTLILWQAMRLPFIKSWLHGNFLIFQQPIPAMVELNGHYVLFKRAFIYRMFEYLLPIALLVLPASLTMGGGLPILDRIAIDNPSVAGRRVGDIHLANILGSVAGTLAISFIFLPLVGSELTLKILVSLSLIFPLLYIRKRIKPLKISRRTIYTLITALVIAGILIAALPVRKQLYLTIFETGVNEHAILQESGESVLALTLSGESKKPEDLWIGGEINSLFPTNGAWEIQSLICSGASHPRRLLIIGFGGGHTANFFTALPDIQEIVIVELIPNLIPFLADNFPFVKTITADARVHVIDDDGRRYLYAHPNEVFDLISIDPLRNYTAGHNNLYSAEAQLLYKQHLAGGGILCEWQDESHIIPKTTATIFPYVDQYNTLSVASTAPIRYNYIDMVQLSKYVQTRTGLALNPINALRGFVRDRGQILNAEISSPILTDLHPWLEYYYFRKPVASQSETPESVYEDFQSRIDDCDVTCQQKLKR